MKNVQHLIDEFENEYENVVDLTESLYYGMTLKWNYDE